jgi:hypothetical protein
VYVTFVWPGDLDNADPAAIDGLYEAFTARFDSGDMSLGMADPVIGSYADTYVTFIEVPGTFESAVGPLRNALQEAGWSEPVAVYEGDFERLKPDNRDLMDLLSLAEKFRHEAHDFGDGAGICACNDCESFFKLQKRMTP